MGFLVPAMPLAHLWLMQAATIGTIVDNAMVAIERYSHDSRGILPKDYGRRTFSQ
jgi:hypothetical protein